MSMNSLPQLLASSSYLSTRQLVETAQQQMPADWVYKPIGIEIEITNSCNLRCEGCAQQLDWKVPNDVLTNENILEFIREGRELGMVAISITGGEATLFLDRVLELLNLRGEIDLYKLNTNGYRFISLEATKMIFTQLKAAGFTLNTQLKPVLVVSLGQQNMQGVPISNAVNAAVSFYDVFDPEEALISFNLTDKNPAITAEIKNTFFSMFEKVSGERPDPRLYPLRSFGLTNQSTLQRLNILSSTQATIPELMEMFQRQYKSWKCLNTLPENVMDLPTLTPRCLVRPDGTLMACPGYNYVHVLGNVQQKGLKQLLVEAQKMTHIRTMMTKGLPALWHDALYAGVVNEDLTMSVSVTPCDLCQFLTRKLRENESL